jgi:hypothetical protein
MKTTKRPYTPVRVMDMLTEIKILCKRNQFVPKNYSEKEPSIWHFVRVLVAKGVLSKSHGVYKWVGGEPNFEMSKAVMEQVQAYAKAKKEESLLRKKNTEKFIAEKIEFPPIENIQKPINESIKNELEPIESSDKVRNKNKLLREENNNIKAELKKQKENFRSLLNELVERKDIILVKEKEIKNYLSTISSLEQENQRMFFENLSLTQKVNNINSKTNYSVNENLQQEIEEIKTLPIEKEAPKKVKLFGITILKIE